MKAKFSGKGMTISLKKEEINNLYKPTSKYKTESFDYLRIVKGFERKFAPILLKEWFSLVKPKGLLVLDYEIENGVDFSFMEGQFWWLFKGNYTIAEHQV